MNLQPSKTLLNKKHDWPVCQTLQCRWRGSWRNYHHEPRQGDNPPTWNQPPAKAPSGSSGRQRAREKMADKEFFLSLLSSAATKRDAKAYLSRFPSIKKSHAPRTSIENTPAAESQAFKEIEKPGVNLGSFYGAARSVHETPVFRQGAALDTDMHSLSLDESLHVALVKLAGAQSLNDETIHGVALTLSQLARLGMASCVVIDPGPVADEQDAKKVAIEQADRLSAAVDACDGGRARRLDSALVKTQSEELPKLISREILLRPLRKSHIVILAPVAYSEQTTKAISVSSNEVMLALTRELAGLERRHDPDEDPRVTAEQFAILQKEVVVDRLIVLDPVGGIPAFKGPQQSHVFVNMEQEFKLIEDELNEEMRSVQAATTSNADSSTLEEQRGIPNATPRITTPSPQQELDSTLEPPGKMNLESLEQHLANLRLLNQTLSLLPPSSSAIISTPSDVANSARPQQDILAVSQVGTRRQKNPLIHNLLTDKPVFSSSLPSERRGQISPYIVQSTFLKRGMPLTLLPDPRIAPWSPENPDSRRLSLNDPRIDLPRLVHLIEDSFNRKLDVQDYLNRIEGKLAGLIIAGEYEGGAILTWESPPDVPDRLRNDPENINRLVPYLDKFAVLKRSQGAGGVADIVFNAMVRTCLPDGVCWRSRKDNPVNKWYFERSRGTWKLGESNWAMFWTTPGVPEDEPLKFKDYEAVCRRIQPSWSDKKSTVD